jgi:Ca2+-binding RTX toxin-like protein
MKSVTFLDTMIPLHTKVKSLAQILTSMVAETLPLFSTGNGIYHTADGQSPYDLMSVNDGVNQVFTGNRLTPPSTANLSVLASLGYRVSNSGSPINKANGTSGNDVFSSTSVADNLNALSGDDLGSGADGDDTISGGDGIDTILGGSGNDRISGDAGNDILYGDLEVVGFSSLSGNDILIGGVGNDFLSGGYGDDLYVVDSINISKRLRHF